MSEGVLVFSWTPQAVIATSDSATTNGALTHHHGQWRFTGCCWSLNASPYTHIIECDDYLNLGLFPSIVVTGEISIGQFEKLQSSSGLR